MQRFSSLSVAHKHIRTGKVPRHEMPINQLERALTLK
jgi:hypothetical protein